MNHTNARWVRTDMPEGRQFVVGEHSLRNPYDPRLNDTAERVEAYGGIHPVLYDSLTGEYFTRIVHKYSQFPTLYHLRLK